jgi:hypothetical protein
MLCLAHLFLLFQANLLLPTAALMKMLKRYPISLFIWSPNWGKGLYPGDECAHTMKEFKLILANQVAASTLSYFTSVIFIPIEQASYVMEVVTGEWGTVCDHYVWHKVGKFGPTGLWVTNVTEVAVVAYYSESRTRLPAHFSNTGDDAMKNLLTFPVIANKVKHQVNGVNEVVNPTEMNIGVLMTIIKNHSNPGEYIADWFSGSGTGAVAAVIMGRHVVSIDIRPDQVCIVVWVCFCIMLFNMYHLRCDSDRVR